MKGWGREGVKGQARGEGMLGRSQSKELLLAQLQASIGSCKHPSKGTLEQLISHIMRRKPFLCCNFHRAAFTNRRKLDTYTTPVKTLTYAR